MIKVFMKKCKSILKNTAEKLSGKDKRKFYAEISKACGKGGQSFVAKEFNVGRDTIRKGRHELETGIVCQDAFNLRGRKKTEVHLPNIKKDISNILETQSQTDPKFQTNRLYTRLSVEEIRKQLIEKYNYKNDVLPTNQTLNTIINGMGFKLRKIQKRRPKKKLPETDAIFDNLEIVHKIAEENDEVVRISIDTKDRVKLGEFSRGGKSRIERNALDHDFGDKYITPFGIMNVNEDKIKIINTKSKVTADFIVDEIEKYWSENNYDLTKKILLINGDNGPENSSCRTQYIKRMVELSVKFDVVVFLAYYPPYHSKYNKIERVWGILEQHWNGDLLDDEKTVIEYEKTLSWNGKNPEVTISDKNYETGIKLSQKEMLKYESVIIRKPGLEKYFVMIDPVKCRKLVNVQSYQ
jgi:hypothetical protein